MRRNHRYFVILLTTSIVMPVYTIVICAAQIVLLYMQFHFTAAWRLLWACPFWFLIICLLVIICSVMLLVCALGLFFSVSTLSCFHYYLAATAQTTHEKVRITLFSQCLLFSYEGCFGFQTHFLVASL